MHACGRGQHAGAHAEAQHQPAGARACASQSLPSNSGQGSNSTQAAGMLRMLTSQASSGDSRPPPRTLPLQEAHRSCGGGAKPVCRQLLQGCWICCIMPGPSGRIMTCMPVPWHSCARAPRAQQRHPHERVVGPVILSLAPQRQRVAAPVRPQPCRATAARDGTSATLNLAPQRQRDAAGAKQGARRAGVLPPRLCAPARAHVALYVPRQGQLPARPARRPQRQPP